MTYLHLSMRQVMQCIRIIQMQTQPYTYAGYKIFVAEVASTCNEAILIAVSFETQPVG